MSPSRSSGLGVKAEGRGQRWARLGCRGTWRGPRAESQLVGEVTISDRACLQWIYTHSLCPTGGAVGVPSSIPAKGSAGVESLLLAAPRAPDALPEGDFLEAWSGGQRPSQVSWVCLPGTPASSCWAAPGGVQATRARRNWMAPCLAGLWKEKAPLDRAPRWTRQGQRRGTGGASDRWGV